MGAQKRRKYELVVWETGRVQGPASAKAPWTCLRLKVMNSVIMVRGFLQPPPAMLLEAGAGQELILTGAATCWISPRKGAVVYVGYCL